MERVDGVGHAVSGLLAPGAIRVRHQQLQHFSLRLCRLPLNTVRSKRSANLPIDKGRRLRVVLHSWLLVPSPAHHVSGALL